MCSGDLVVVKLMKVKKSWAQELLDTVSIERVVNTKAQSKQIRSFFKYSVIPFYH